MDNNAGLARSTEWPKDFETDFDSPPTALCATQFQSKASSIPLLAKSKRSRFRISSSGLCLLEWTNPLLSKDTNQRIEMAKLFGGFNFQSAILANTLEIFARLVPANLDPIHNSIDVSLEHCFLHSMRSLIVHLHQPAAASWVLSIGRHKNNFLTFPTRKHKWDCSANGAGLCAARIHGGWRTKNARDCKIATCKG